LGAVAQGAEARYPAGDVSAIGFVLGAKGSSECRLLIDKDKQVRDQPGKDCVREEVQVAQQEGLAENHRCDRDVHGVSDVAVGAFDDQVFCGKDGCWGADALEGEAGRRLPGLRRCRRLSAGLRLRGRA
jgi:hypothetical protein